MAGCSLREFDGFFTKNLKYAPLGDLLQKLSQRLQDFNTFGHGLKLPQHGECV